MTEEEYIKANFDDTAQLEYLGRNHDDTAQVEYLAANAPDSVETQTQRTPAVARQETAVAPAQESVNPAAAQQETGQAGSNPADPALPATDKGGAVVVLEPGEHVEKPG